MKINRHRKGLIRPLVLALALTGIPVVASAATATTATAATCATTTASWGSLPKSLNRPTAPPITNVRAGRHTCFDRMVVDLNGKGGASYRVRYVSQVTTGGGGEVVPVRGGARLAVVIFAPAYDDNGRPTYRFTNPRELVNVTGFSTFRQIAWAGSFEATTTIGLGVRARLPMRVFLLAGPGSNSRVVVDVAHRW